MSALHSSSDDTQDNWVIESGCTHHMTCRQDWFVEFTEIGPTKILLGDYHSIETSGRGTIRLNTKEGSVKLMKDVRYVPSLRRNVISTSTLDRLGFTHSRRDGKIMFQKNNKMALQRILKNSMYILDGETVTSEACYVEKTQEVSLWHSRLGHMSYMNMQVVVKNGVLKKRDIETDSMCEHCIVGKAKKVSFEVGQHSSNQVLEYLHADLWGSPNVTPSLSGNQYFFSIIDDFSRKL